MSDSMSKTPSVGAKTSLGEATPEMLKAASTSAKSFAKSAMSSLASSMPSLASSMPSLTSAKSSLASAMPSLASSMPSLASSMPAAAAAAASAANNKYPFVRYTFIILILIFLAFNLFLYLEKPENKGLYKFYEPILNKFTWGRKLIKAEVNEEKKKNDKAALDKLNATLEKKRKAEKTISNKIDDKTNKSKEKKMKKTQIVPVADDSTSRTQMSKPASKAGFCYIGEDRGFRSCIEVGEGDVCMSGDIFPTQDVCVNPKLRA